MKIYQLKRHQFLPVSIAEGWNFFSNPLNLKTITPPSMDFRVMVPPAGSMYAGMMIEYSVRPMFGIPLRWVTEITHVREPEFFVDEQRFGPYAFWHHQHSFKEVPGGIEMTDIVSYALPFGFLGSIVRELFVKKKLETIFDYRRDVLNSMFQSR